MIGIIDYGSGNIRAIANVYSRLDVPFKLARRPGDLTGIRKIVLPGVGAFDQVVAQLEGSGLRPHLDEMAKGAGLPVLGICVGMQILSRTSEEGNRPGLGWIDADVRRFDERLLTGTTRLPHMGWNDVAPVSADGLFEGLGAGARFYFLHSYYMECDRREDVLATCEYGRQFACAVRSGHIYGVQFHPEKSHGFGVRLLKNFADL